MRFSTGTSILLSLLTLESSLAIPAPQAEIVSDVVTSSAEAIPSAAPGGCKAGANFGVNRGHRRPRPFGQPSASSGGGSEVPSPSSSSGSDIPSDAPSASDVSSTSTSEEPIPITSTLESEVQMPSDASSSAPEASSAEVTEVQHGNAGVSTGGPGGSGNQGDGNQQPTQAGPAQPTGTPDPRPSQTQSSIPPPQSSAPAQSGGGGGAPEGFPAEILQAHNDYRASYNGAPPLVWDQAIADQGTAWYQDKNCEMKHSEMKGLGENLAWGPGLTGQNVVDMWGPDEAVDWSPGDMFKNGTGHFTQVVWKETTNLGCGQLFCGSNSLVFCEYKVPGNMVGNSTFFDSMVAP